MSRHLARIGNRIGVWLYRRLDGRLSSGRKDVHVLLITVPGRRTGVTRSTCVRFLTTSEGLVVWGTGSGSPRDPDWFQNLRVATVAEVQVGNDQFRARPQELFGDARDAMWTETILDQAPEVARYARKAARTIPVALLHGLEPLSDKSGVTRSAAVQALEPSVAYRPRRRRRHRRPPWRTNAQESPRAQCHAQGRCGPGLRPTCVGCSKVLGQFLSIERICSCPRSAGSSAHSSRLRPCRW